MTKFIENLYRINNNTFLLTPLIVEFYRKLEKTENNILLSYLVLPLVLSSKSKEALLSSSTRSSIFSFVSCSLKNKSGVKNVENIFGLPEKIKEYKEVTNRCLQHAIDNGLISINDDLSVSFLNSIRVCSSNLKPSFKASTNLHKVFKNLDVVTIYRILGIKKL